MQGRGKVSNQGKGTCHMPIARSPKLSFYPNLSVGALRDVEKKSTLASKLSADRTNLATGRALDANFPHSAGNRAGPKNAIQRFIPNVIERLQQPVVNCGTGIIRATPFRYLWRGRQASAALHAAPKTDCSWSRRQSSVLLADLIK